MSTHLYLRIVLVILFVGSFVRVGLGQGSFQIADSVDQHIFVYGYMQYLEDSTGQLTFEDVRTEPHTSTFTDNPDFAPHNDRLASAYWIRVRIQHTRQSDKKWVLEFFDQTIDSITAYLPGQHGGYRSVILGDRAGFAARRIKHKNFLLPLNNDHDQTLMYYFRIKADHPVDILLVLRSVDFLVYYATNEYFLFGLFYGLILLICLYNLLLYVAIREVPYLYLVLYALSVGLYFSSLDGIAYQYLWPSAPVWNEVAYGVFRYLMVLFSLLLTQRFLHTKHRAPQVHQGLTIIIVARTLYFILSVLWFPRWLDHQLIDVLPLLASLYAGGYLFRQKYQPARLFVLAYAILTGGVVIKLLLSTGLGNIGSSVIAYYSINVTLLIQLITLSFSLGDKVRIIKRREGRALRRVVEQLEVNAQLQNKVNRELEEKVRERTATLDQQNSALQEANRQLEVQAEEINRMNQLLDRDNWKLKRQSQEVIRKNLLSRGVSLEEFKTMFPNRVTCLRYLAELKWGAGFVCKKCQYERATDHDTFAKRCSRCGYVESPTSHTIFHNVRFSLEKAFYIAHVVISSLPISATKLSEQLDLRVATCSNFKRKAVRWLQTTQPSDDPQDSRYLVEDAT